jgi:hypothetical protein
MYKYIPVPVAQHATLLGPDFATKFANEMISYYAPFVNKNRVIQVAKETWEYGVADSVPGASWTGSGNSVVDVRAPNIEIDVKGISIDRVSRGVTTEASFLQNFRTENDNFVTLFQNQDFAGLKQMWVDVWVEKVKTTQNLHLLAIVREKSTNAVYYCLLAVVDVPITDAEFISKMTTVGRSVTLPLIDEQYGKTYILLSKRRMEIRLNCDGLKDFLVYSHHSR